MYLSCLIHHERNSMEEVKNENLEVEIDKVNKVEEAEQKMRDKKNTFTLIYILVGLFGIAVLGMLIYAFIVTR